MADNMLNSSFKQKHDETLKKFTTVDFQERSLKLEESYYNDDNSAPRSIFT